MGKTIKSWWALVIAATLVLPAVVRADDEETEEEVTTSDEAKPGRKLSGAEDGAEDEEVAENSDSEEATTTASNDTEEAAPTEEKDARGEKLFKRLKGLVKKFDTRTSPYPSPVIESAVRNEFLRQAEGKRDFAWLRGKNLEGGDRTVAQDNFALFLDYAEKIGASKGKAKKDADLLVVKGLIDRYGRSGISANEPPEGLGKAGRGELKRQYAMLGRLVSGPGYEPLKFAKLEDAGKAYKARLTSARGEFEKLAKAMGGSKKVVKRSDSSGNDRKPASTKGKKAGKDKSKGKKKSKK